MQDFSAVILGIVEGLTEFLPVSSTGHLILLVDLLGFKGPAGHVFEIFIQLGAILAVCWLYRAKIGQLLRGVLVLDMQTWRFARNLKLAFLPAAVLGVLFHAQIKTVLFSPLVVAIALLVGGVAILLIERFKPQPIYNSTEEMPWPIAVLIGFFQALAMIPGVSRSGATIMGALLCKMERKAATEFSFFLAIPTMLGATGYDLYSNWHDLHGADISPLAIGFMAAFITAMLVVRAAIGWVSKHGFAAFAYYRILLGSFMLLLLNGVI